MADLISRTAALNALSDLYERLVRGGNQAPSESAAQQLFFTADGVKSAIDIVREL